MITKELTKKSFEVRMYQLSFHRGALGHGGKIVQRRRYARPNNRHCLNIVKIRFSSETTRCHKPITHSHERTATSLSANSPSIHTSRKSYQTSVAVRKYKIMMNSTSQKLHVRHILWASCYCYSITLQVRHPNRKEDGSGDATTTL